MPAASVLRFENVGVVFDDGTNALEGLSFDVCHGETRIILGAARLSARRISEIMIPVTEIVTLDLRHSMSESLVLAHADMHTRFLKLLYHDR